MKNTVLDDPKKRRHYIELMVAEASDQDARKLEQKFFVETPPDMAVMQKISFAIFKYQAPLTAANFLDMLKRLGIEMPV